MLKKARGHHMNKLDAQSSRSENKIHYGNNVILRNFIEQQ